MLGNGDSDKHFYLRRQPSGLRMIGVVVLVLVVLVVLVLGEHYFEKPLNVAKLLKTSRNDT